MTRRWSASAPSSATCETLPDDLGENPFPASVEATLRPGRESPEEVQRLVAAFEKAPGVEEVQYDLLWIQRLATAIRLVRGVGALLGGILVLAGVFTISNVIRLTVYARQDELDIMRLVGATRAYVKGPFVVEGLIQGGLGGLISVGLLWGAFRVVAKDALAASDLHGPRRGVPPARRLRVHRDRRHGGRRRGQPAEPRPFARLSVPRER